MTESDQTTNPYRLRGYDFVPGVGLVTYGTRVISNVIRNRRNLQSKSASEMDSEVKSFFLSWFAIGLYQVVIGTTLAAGLESLIR